MFLRQKAHISTDRAIRREARKAERRRPRQPTARPGVSGIAVFAATFTLATWVGGGVLAHKTFESIHAERSRLASIAAMATNCPTGEILANNASQGSAETGDTTAYAPRHTRSPLFAQIALD